MTRSVLLPNSMKRRNLSKLRIHIIQIPAYNPLQSLQNVSEKHLQKQHHIIGHGNQDYSGSITYKCDIVYILQCGGRGLCYGIELWGTSLSIHTAKENIQ